MTVAQGLGPAQVRTGVEDLQDALAELQGGDHGRGHAGQGHGPPVPAWRRAGRSGGRIHGGAIVTVGFPTGIDGRWAS